jgi:3-oxoacyl-[acyl-carrier-protein] synthase II
MMRSVVITGMGMRTPMGHSMDAVRAGFLSGQPVIRRIDGPDGRIRAFAKMDEDFSIGFTKLEQSMLDPVTMMAVVAADDTLSDSAMTLGAVDRRRIGVYLGTGQGASGTAYRSFTDLALKDRIKPYSILQGLFNGPANHISIRHGLRGACETVVLACSSSNAAMGMAFRAIRHGYLDAALTGGVEATFHEGVIRAWEAMRVLALFDPDNAAVCCRPFDKQRTGLVLGEGAVFFMFEAEDHARARGARIYARVAGYGASADATHITVPDAQGQALALQNCLDDADLVPADIGYINAHGTATPAGDPIEVQSMRMVMGKVAEQIPISATKSLHGHLLGAAGAIELLAVIAALQDGLIAPTANLHDPDPACDLDFVPLVARTGVDVRAGVSTSFAFGGSNACIALTRA